MKTNGWIAAVVLGLGAGVACAQSTTLELDDGGEGWVVVEEPGEGSDEAVLGKARRLLADGSAKRAWKMLTAWIEKNERSGSPLLPEALLLRGDAKTASGNEYKALYDYEQICLEYPGSDMFVKACERELEIAIRYVNGLPRKTFGIRFEQSRQIGEELLVRVQERLPGSRLAERAGIELADYYYRQRDMRTASEAYAIFLTNFPNSEHRKRAMQRRVYANIAKFKGPEYDASGLIEAKYLIREFEERYPIDAERTGLGARLIARLDESAAAQMLSVAEWYERTGDWVAARYTLRRLVAEYPRTVATMRALEMAEEKGWALVEAAPTEVEPIGPELPAVEGGAE